MSPLRHHAGALLCALAALACWCATAGATPGNVHVTLDWSDCADAPGFECATAELPRDYGSPGGRTLSIAVTRLPARDQKNKVGSLFVNYGGPGGDGGSRRGALGGGRLVPLTGGFCLR